MAYCVIPACHRGQRPARRFWSFIKQTPSTAISKLSYLQQSVKLTLTNVCLGFRLLGSPLPSFPRFQNGDTHTCARTGTHPYRYTGGLWHRHAPTCACTLTQLQMHAQAHKGTHGEDMCVDTCASMRMDMCAEMCIDMCVGMSVSVCISICVSMCAAMCIDVCTGMCMDVCGHVYV